MLSQLLHEKHTNLRGYVLVICTKMDIPSFVELHFVHGHLLSLLTTSTILFLELEVSDPKIVDPSRQPKEGISPPLRNKPVALSLNQRPFEQAKSASYHKNNRATSTYCVGILKSATSSSNVIDINLCRAFWSYLNLCNTTKNQILILSVLQFFNSSITCFFAVKV